MQTKAQNSAQGGCLRSITLLGSSSGRNAGDAALMAGIMDEVDKACGRRIRYEIPTICPAYVRTYYPNDVAPVGMLPWNLSVKMLGLPTLSSIMRTDLTIIFDAILFDRDLYNPLFNFLSTLYLLLPHARRRGKRIIGYDIGAGPFDKPMGKRMLRAVCDTMAFATLRDQGSMDWLLEVGVSTDKIRLAADAALNAPSVGDAEADRLIAAAGLDPSQRIYGININKYLDSWATPGRATMSRERFLGAFAAALDRVVAEFGMPLLFVTTQYHDDAITRELMARLRPGTRMGLVTNRALGHAAIKGIFRRLHVLFGMRLHSAIMATAELTPTVALVYQPKVAYYFNHIALGGYAMHFDHFDEERLTAHLRRGWLERDALRAHLERTIPPLRAVAAQAAQLVALLDRGEDPLPALRGWP